MKVHVDMSICLLHGQCVIAAPQVFSFNDEGGLVWLAVSREPAWPGAALTAVGVAWLAFAWRRRRG